MFATKISRISDKLTYSEKRITNLLLERMESGESFDAAVDYARSIGIAETDPSADVDGWDAAIKVAALATVLMGIPLKPQQVQREGMLVYQGATKALDYGQRGYRAGYCYPFGLGISPTPDRRNNRSGGVNFKAFVDAIGSHEIDGSDHPAQHDSFATSLSKVCAASLSPSTVVR